MRPTGSPSEKLIYNEENNSLNVVKMSKKQNDYINNTRDSYSYQFTKIFKPLVKQEEVFDTIGRDIVE